MKLHLTVFLLVFISCKSSFTDSKSMFDEGSEKALILDVMKMQEQAWSDGDIDQFMEGYWNSPELRFVGSRGVTYGWQQTKENYKRGYPDKKAMGKLSFEILDVDFLSEESVLLLGKFKLIREEDEPSGLFTLSWKKIKGKWLITSDMTCG